MMPSWLIALFFGVGVSAWVYTKLARANGNPSPRQNFMGAALAGAVAFFVLFTLFTFVFNF